MIFILKSIIKIITFITITTNTKEVSTQMTALYIKDFPDDLHRALRIRAAEEGTSLKGIVIRLLWEALKREEPKKERRR